MDTSRVALVGAPVTTTAWAAKALAIGVAGGLGKSPFETPLFFLGMVSALITVGALTLSRVPDRRLGVQIAAVAVGLVVMFAFTGALVAIFSAISPTGASWVWGELNLWIVALVLLGLAIRTGTRPSTSPASSAS
ncbi:MAG TPA: hypothetical protein PK868_06150 [Phycicoccus sp.]|jgi:hypothetical protein|nr:hypothetical protein [Phycicoccus sp.]HQH07636.1 hypothetical protein [Phycicoccus sp.]HQK30401.1 hypothetical protein [Phycicoccus sp.]